MGCGLSTTPLGIKFIMLTSSELNSILSSQSNCNKLKLAIQNDLPEFRRGKSIIGGTAPISLKDMGNNFILTKSVLANLCNCYLNNAIDEIELEYIASALELSDDFEYEQEIDEEIFLLATPEINGPITKELVKEIINRLINNA